MLNALQQTGTSIRERAYQLPVPPIARSIAEVLVRIGQNFFRNDGTHMAAGVAYYSFFSLFPLVLAIIAISSFFISTESTQERITEFIANQVPGSAGRNLIDFIDSTLEGELGVRAIGVISLIGLLWAGRAVLGAVHRVVNRAWRIPEPPHFITQQMGQLGVAFALGSIFFLTVAIGILGRLITQAEAAAHTELLHTATAIGVNALSILMSVGTFTFIYKYVTDVKLLWVTALAGGVAAGLLFEGAKLAFVFYLDRFANFDRVYGGVSTAAILMLWFYVIGIIIVVGAEVAAEFRRSRAAGRLDWKWRPVRGGLGPVLERPSFPRVYR
ncbi:MAG: YihY/virulence factor BrkB family protein [Dehalococcoidia bacterium]|nr:YihY/virulence factor BrkB family protein [Dehalococcoidia bacterium]